MLPKKLSVEKLLKELYECNMRKCEDVSIGDIMLLEDIKYGVGCDNIWCSDGDVWCGDDGYKMEITVKLKGLSESGRKWICEWYKREIEKEA